LMQRNDFSVGIQISTGTLLRENTYRTNVPLLCVGFIGAQSISYLLCSTFNAFDKYII
jgi:hypothetical protein